MTSIPATMTAIGITSPGGPETLTTSGVRSSIDLSNAAHVARNSASMSRKRFAGP